MGMEIEGDGRARISSTRSGSRSRLASCTSWQSRQPEKLHLSLQQYQLLNKAHKTRWIKHHYFAMAMALISLTWETQKQARRMDVVWGETAEVDGQLWLLAPILFILQPKDLDEKLEGYDDIPKEVLDLDAKKVQVLCRLRDLSLDGCGS